MRFKIGGSLKKRWLWAVIVLCAAALAGIYYCKERQNTGGTCIKVDVSVRSIDYRGGKASEKMLKESLALGTEFLVNNQLPEGNFNYSYNWVDDRMDADDNEVRQAGALWGLTLIYQYRPSEKLLNHIRKSLDFFNRNSFSSGDARFIKYGNSATGRTGTVALVALAHIDLLRSDLRSLSSAEKRLYEKYMNEYVNFLVKARTSEGLWHQSYNSTSGKAFGKNSSYFDGESLLALVKAARYGGRTDLKEIILNSADAGFRTNIERALKEDEDSPITKGYYQWSSMAFYEIGETGWKGSEKYRACVIDLAYWMINVHRTLSRNGNTAYAYEGIIHAWRAARDLGDMRAENYFRNVIDAGLHKLTTWQVGHSAANSYIRKHTIKRSIATGGVQNHRSRPDLRIDVTQHQMHAVVLALKYVYARQLGEMSGSGHR